MDVDLRSVFSVEPGETDELDAFISRRLFEAGVWSSPRTSDGLEHLRVLEWERERVSLCGRIYEIDQTLRSFWLDVERAPSGLGVTWRLAFDMVCDSPRRERNALDTRQHADELDWRVVLSGEADVGNRSAAALAASDGNDG